MPFTPKMNEIVNRMIEPRVLVTGMCADNPEYDTKSFAPSRLITDISRVFLHGDVEHSQHGIKPYVDGPGHIYSRAIDMGLRENYWRMRYPTTADAAWEGWQFDPSASHWFKEDARKLSEEQKLEVRNLREEMIRLQ